MAMRVPVVLAVFLIAAGCGSSGESGGDAASSGGASSAAALRVEKCVERFLARATSDDAAVRHYAEDTYCSPFEREGWVYEDGTLSIAAYLFVARGYSEECASSDGGEGDTVPCPDDEPVVLDCGVLHLVRRGEVQQYVRELERHRR